MSEHVQVHVYDERNNLLASRTYEHHVPAVGDWVSLRPDTSRKVVGRQFHYDTGKTQVSLTVDNLEVAQ